MTLVLLAVAVAVLVWPATRRADLRLRRLVDATRLAGAAQARRGRRWRQPAVPPRSSALFAACAAGVAAFAWRGTAVAVAAGVAAAVIAGSIIRALARRDLLARDRDLSAALRLLRAELDVGSRPEPALLAAASVAGAHRPAFEAGARAVRDGTDIVVAMSGGGAQPVPELVLIAQAWALADVTGAPLADVLGRVDDDVRARRAQVRAVASALAGPRSSAVLLAALPVLGAVLGTAMGGRPLAVLFDSAGGRWLLCAGVLLDAAGLVWTSRLVSSAERG